ncbi:MAG: NUDIX domain-containing protein [Thermoguttaceae bacterium]|jgi:predicted NUDIX family NTP pyrophosphohydrolase
MPPVSAGLMMYRFRKTGLQVLLVHPGGPVWKNKDDGVWSVPKGEVEPGEDLLTTAQREFKEELGFKPLGQFVGLKPIKQKSGKMVHAWAFQGDCDPTKIESNLCTMEWPPGSGRQIQFPEVDKAVFFDLDVAKRKVNPGQVGLLEELEALVQGNRS